MLIASLSACSPKTEPKPESENTTAQANETVPEDEFKPTMAEYDPILDVQDAPQEEFEVRVHREESQHSMTGYVDKLNIISLNNDPTTLTGVSINRGNCGTQGFYDYQNMRYGSVAQLYLGCAADYIREVTITTNSGLSYTYNF